MRLFLAGLFSWLPSFLVHPSAIVVPGVIGVLYLVLEWKKIRSLQSVFIGVGLVLGCVFFLYLIHSMKEFAVAAGGGNYFNYQGPPILVRGLKYLPTIPLAFYKKFTSINVFSRPLCFFIFTSGMLLLIASRKAHREYFKKQHSTILLIVLFTSLTLLYLLSGSFGNYNVVVAPFIMIIFTIIISKIIFYNGNKKAATLLASFLLFSCFIVDAINIPKDIRFAKEYNEMLVTAKENISLKSGEGVMALALYYEPFKDQNFYSNSWFNQYAGIPGQSFEHAVKELNVKYVILDDAFVGRAILDRGIHWTDSMMTFLADSGQVVNEKNVKYFVGNRVPAPTRYPKYWQYDGQAASYIKKMKIIKIKTAE